ncbi:MAG: nucleotidyltransferase domain-containing protein [Desulfobacterales bacterium]|jgi:hypothetical protein
MFKEMNDNQRRVYLDAVQLYEAFISAFQKSRSYRGGMHWKKAKGRQYLFKTRDRYGYGKSLGPRSIETEKILADFRTAKKEAKDRLATLKKRLNEQSRFCKAAMIQRVPRIVTGVLRVLEQRNLLGQNILVIGTNAMYAYEAAAGVFLDRPLTATRDIDILWDVRPKLTLFAEYGTDPIDLIDLLRKADKSFEPAAPGSFRAVNRDGYMVDLIKPESKSLVRSDPVRMGGPGDLKAAEIRNLHWLISSPKFSQVIIGDDGYPVSMVVPDPRAFSIHKVWLSEQPDREAIRKKRDHDQGLAIALLVIKYLPQYKFEASELRMFPKDVVQKLKKKISMLSLDTELDLI